LTIQNHSTKFWSASTSL